MAGAIVTGLAPALVLAFTIRHEYRLARLARVDDATGRLHAAASTIQMLLITRRTFTTDGHDTFAAFNRAAFEVIARARSTYPVLAQACEELVRRINDQLAELDARTSQLELVKEYGGDLQWRVVANQESTRQPGAVRACSRDGGEVLPLHLP